MDTNTSEIPDFMKNLLCCHKCRQFIDTAYITLKKEMLFIELHKGHFISRENLSTMDNICHTMELGVNPKTLRKEMYLSGLCFEKNGERYTQISME